MLFMKKKDIACLKCEYVGKPKLKVKGNLAVEIFLWLFFLLPGILYTLWRSASAYYGCPICGSDSTVPLTSPRGEQILAAKNNPIKQ